MMKLIFTCLLLLVKIFAAPSVYGPTGLIEMPTAESVAYKQFNVAVDYTMTERTNETTDRQFNITYYKFNLGSFENWELGILGGTFLEEGVYVNMKHLLMTNQEEDTLSISAGFEKIGARNDMSAYLVTSKKFQDGLNGHFGFKAFFQNNFYAAAMLGFEYFTNETVSFLVDLLGEKSQNYVLNAGVNILIEEDISIRLNILDITQNRAANETVYTLGISFNRYI